MKRFIGFTKGYRILTIICPFLIFLDVIIEIEIPKAMGKVVDILYKFETVTDTSSLWGQLSQKLIEMLLLCAFTLVVGYFAARCSAIASMGFGANLRRALFNKTQDLSFENIDKLKISSLITRMTNDVTMCQNVYKNTIVTFIKGPFMLITALSYSLEISKELSSVLFVALPAIVIVLAIMGYIAVPIFKKMLKKTDEFNGTLRGSKKSHLFHILCSLFVDDVNDIVDGDDTYESVLLVNNGNRQKVVFLCNGRNLFTVIGCFNKNKLLVVTHDVGYKSILII